MISKVLLVDANLVGVFFHIELIVQQLLKDIDDKNFPKERKRKKKWEEEGLKKIEKNITTNFSSRKKYNHLIIS